MLLTVLFRTFPSDSCSICYTVTVMSLHTQYSHQRPYFAMLKSDYPSFTPVSYFICGSGQSYIYLSYLPFRLFMSVFSATFFNNAAWCGNWMSYVSCSLGQIAFHFFVIPPPYDKLNSSLDCTDCNIVVVEHYHQHPFELLHLYYHVSWHIMALYKQHSLSHVTSTTFSQ